MEFVLQEGTDRILVFDASLATLDGTITLSVPIDQPDFGAEWHKDPNSRGEGLLLLRNGHLLVLASWIVDPRSGVKSVNDLACDDAGQLHLLSSKSRVIARIDGHLVPEDGTAMVTAWELPDDLFAKHDDKAEGLVFAPPLGWLVALDLEREAPNVFPLSGVPRQL